MTTFDLHFHANIKGLLKRHKAQRLSRITAFLESRSLDYLASTEHSYKGPLEAYQRLADATAHLNTRIIPGVEAVSAEGVDILFLYRTEADLAQAMTRLRSFCWSVLDVERISRDTGGLTIVPHPFHIGRSSAGNVLSTRAFELLLDRVDYVEIHNGSALTLDKQLSRIRKKPLFKKTASKLNKTIELPEILRGNSLGWAVGSDAHYPGEQFFVGATDLEPAPGQDAIDFLAERIHFTPQPLWDVSDRNFTNNYRLCRSFHSAMREGMLKQRVKFTGRAAGYLTRAKNNILLSQIF